MVTGDSSPADGGTSGGHVALVLTQDVVFIFDVHSDTQLQSFAVADVDCQLVQTAVSVTRLVFTRHTVATVTVSRTVFAFFCSNYLCISCKNHTRGTVERSKKLHRK